MGLLIGFLAIDRPGLLKSQSSLNWIETQKQLVDDLPNSEFPEIAGLKQRLFKSAISRSAQVDAKQPSFGRADRFANCLIGALKALISTNK